MHVRDVNELERRYTVRRVFLPTQAVESFTVIGPDRRRVEIVDEYLSWLTNNERSPNTVEAYAHDLRAFWTFLDEHGLSCERPCRGTQAHPGQGQGVPRQGIRTSWRVDAVALASSDGAG